MLNDILFTSSNCIKELLLTLLPITFAIAFSFALSDSAGKNLLSVSKICASSSGLLEVFTSSWLNSLGFNLSASSTTVSGYACFAKCSATYFSFCLLVSFTSLPLLSNIFAVPIPLFCSTIIVYLPLVDLLSDTNGAFCISLGFCEDFKFLCFFISFIISIYVV